MYQKIFKPRASLPNTKNLEKQDTKYPYCSTEIPYTWINKTSDTQIPKPLTGPAKKCVVDLAEAVNQTDLMCAVCQCYVLRHKMAHFSLFEKKD